MIKSIKEAIRNYRTFKFNAYDKHGNYKPKPGISCHSFSDRYSDEEINRIINYQVEGYNRLFKDEELTFSIENVTGLTDTLSNIMVSL